MFLRKLGNSIIPKIIGPKSVDLTISEASKLFSIYKFSALSNQPSFKCVQNMSYGCFKLRRPKGQLSHKGKSSSNNPKKQSKRRVGTYRLPNHNGLLKRIRIVTTLAKL